MDFCFLLSSERSGSNLITRLMDGHGEVCGPTPTHLFRILLEQRFRYGDLDDPTNWNHLLVDTVALTETKLGRWATTVSVDELTTEVESGSLGGVLRYVYEKEAAAWGARILFVKENHVYRHVAFLEREFPGSTFVFLTRDPRDMALSWKRSTDLRGGVIRAAETWQLDQCSALALYGALEDSGRIVGLRYEDLVDRPAEQLTRVCEMLRIGYEPGMIALDARRSNRENAEATGGWANIAKPVMTGNFGKYRSGLTTEEIQFVEGTCAREMEFLGYAPDQPDRPSLVTLRASVQPHELWVKPAYDDQPADARERHARRAAVLAGIGARPAARAWR